MNILIVDDSEILQTRLKKSLMEAIPNISISQAGSYKETLDKFLPESCDTIILDIALPDESGINLLKKFKKDYPQIKVVMFTNYPESQFKRECMKLGADDYVNKSDYNKLINIINKIDPLI